MYGWILTLFKEYLHIHSHDKIWKESCRHCGLSLSLHRHESVEEDRALMLIRTIMNHLSPYLDGQVLLEEIGELYLQTLISQGYDALFRCLGSNFEEWFSNLNKIHSQLETIFPEVAPPEFWCVSLPSSTPSARGTAAPASGATSTSSRSGTDSDHEFLFYYLSQRPHASDLFLPMTCGLVRAIATEYFSTHIRSMKLQTTQGVLDSPHTSWRISTQSMLKEPRITARKFTQSATPRSGRCPFFTATSPPHLHAHTQVREFSESPSGSVVSSSSKKSVVSLHPPPSPSQLNYNLSASQISGFLATDESPPPPCDLDLAKAHPDSNPSRSAEAWQQDDLPVVNEGQEWDYPSPDLDQRDHEPTRANPSLLSRIQQFFRRSKRSHHKLVPVSPHSSGCPALDEPFPFPPSEPVPGQERRSLPSTWAQVFRRRKVDKVPSALVLSPIDSLFLSIGISSEQADRLYPFYLLFDCLTLSILSSGTALTEYVDLTDPETGSKRTLEDLFLLEQPKKLSWAMFQHTIEMNKQDLLPVLGGVTLTIISRNPSLRCPPDHKLQGFRLTGQVISSPSSSSTSVTTAPASPVSAALFLAKPFVSSTSDMLSQGLTLSDLDQYPLIQSLVMQSEIMKLETRVSLRNEKEADELLSASHSLAKEMKSVATRAEEALDVKKIFVRTVSHEIRTPLTVAKMGLSLLEKDFANTFRITATVPETPPPRKPSSDLLGRVSAPGSRVNSPREKDGPSPRHQPSTLSTITPTALSLNTAQIQESIQDIQLSIDTAIHILNDLLAYEKLESGILVAYKSLQPVQAFVLESIRPFRLQANEKAISLQVEECADTCFSESGSVLRAEDMLLFIDDKKISQVIRNLLSNAIKFTPERGSVVVRFHYSTDTTTTGAGPQRSAKVVSPTTTGGEGEDEDIEGKVVEVDGEQMVVQRRGSLTMEFIDTGPGITEVTPFSLPITHSVRRRTNTSSSKKSFSSPPTSSRTGEARAWDCGVSLPPLPSSR
jgi:signal transduction histidine kinase